MKGGCRILVTGGTGFIGSHLVETLVARGVRPRVLVRRTSETSRLIALGVELVEGTLEDPVVAAEAVRDVEVVFHLAAVTKARSESAYHSVNAEGTRVLIDAMVTAQSRPRRLVYLSSLAAAGPAENGRPVHHGDAPHPITAYGRSKLVGEQYCLAAAKMMEVVALRAPAVYGPRDQDLFMYFRLATFGVLPVPSGPDRLIQFIHVDDLVEALIRAATTTEAAGIYYVAEAQPYANSEIATWIAKAVGRRVATVRIPQWAVHLAAAASEMGAACANRVTIFNREKAYELLAPAWLCDTEPAKRDLGFEARIPLPRGLATTAAWYREQGWL